MSRNAYPWMKLDRSYLTDVIFMRLPDETKWCYFGCYLLACEADAGGYIAQANKPMLDEDISFALRISLELTNKSLQILVDSGLVSKENGCYVITRFLDEQGPEGPGDIQEKKRVGYRERQRKHREKIKGEKNKLEPEQEPEQIIEDETRLDKSVTRDIYSLGQPDCSMIFDPINDDTSDSQVVEKCYPETQYQAEFLKKFHRRWFSLENQRIFQGLEMCFDKQKVINY